METEATSFTADWNASSFAFEGLLKPVILRTNCREAARISSLLTGGSKLKSVLILRHINRRPGGRESILAQVGVPRHPMPDTGKKVASKGSCYNSLFSVA